MTQTQVQCPECGAVVWDLAFANKLNKCWGCGLAFDTDEEPAHQNGCICADCSGAELTADND